ncbi:MAG: LysE family translocator [Gammaproteobacteria bacterium]
MLLPIEALTAFIFASAVLCFMPGPDNLFVLSQSALYGKKSGLFVTLGLCTGLLVHTLVVALGLAVVIQNASGALTAIKLAGAAYLLYLAWLAFTAKTISGSNEAAIQVSSAAMYRRGIIMNISNPKVSIFFLAFLPQFASTDYGPLTAQMIFLGGVFILVTFAIFSLFALMSGMLGNFLRTKSNAQLYINRVAGLVLTALAIGLISSNV